MKKPLIDAHGEVRELTTEDMAGFKPISEAAPDLLAHIQRSVGQRGIQKLPTKEPVSLRLDPKVVAYFRNSGKGWQSRINHVLSNYVDAAASKTTSH